MARVIVTGGAGFIGSNLVDALITDGYEVHVIDNLSNGKREQVHSNANLHVVDVCDFDKLSSIFTSFDGAVDYVIHLAALPRVQFSIERPIESHNVNVNGTLNVLLAARDTRVKKVVYAASSSAYGDQDTLPLHEEMEARPKSPYGLQKYIGELECKIFSSVYNLPTVSLRFFNVYGPKFNPYGPYALVIGKFLEQHKKGEPLTITGDGEQTRDFTNVKDVVRAIKLALESTRVGSGEVINIGAVRNVSINTLADLIGGPREYLPARLEPKHTLADIRRAKDLLGWSPQVSIEEGIVELKSLFHINN